MNKHTITLPNGKIETRTSKTRVYTHAVFAIIEDSTLLIQIENRKAAIAKCTKAIAAYESNLKDLSQGIVTPDMVFSNCGINDPAKLIVRVQNNIDANKNMIAQAEKAIADRQSKLGKGYIDVSLEGWSQSRVNAEKMAQAARRHWSVAKIEIVEVSRA